MRVTLPRPATVPNAALAFLLAASLAACGSQPAIQPLNLTGHEALAVRGGVLQAIPLDGGPPTSLAATTASFCVADPRARVVFLLEKEAGSQKSRLRMIDLERDNRAYTIARGVPKVDVLVVEHDGYGMVDDPQAVSHRMAAVLRMGPEPKIFARLGCKGDDGWLCDTVASHEGLLERINALKLENVETLQAVFRRAGRRPIWRTESATAALPRVRVPLDRCFDKTKCEVAHPVPGTPYWTVVTANEATPVYERTLSWRQFFDPKTGEFFDPDTPGLRSKTPLEASTRVSRLIVSPTGKAFIKYGEVVHFEKGVLADGALPCGFVDGGWVLGGWPFN